MLVPLDDALTEEVHIADGHGGEASTDNLFGHAGRADVGMDRLATVSVGLAAAAWAFFWQSVVSHGAKEGRWLYERVALRRKRSLPRRQAPPVRKSAQVDGSGTAPAMMPTPG